MSNETVITKENLYEMLKLLGKEYRRLTKGKARAEIVMVGGSAVLAGYDFRESTVDIDAIINAASAMTDAIRRVGDLLELPHDWLNAEFQSTSSYSPKLVQYSEPYRVFSHVLEVRIIRAAYLVAMKLKAGRLYKKDMSDVVGILAEHAKRGHPICFEEIDKAVVDLYGSWEEIDPSCTELLMRALQTENLLTLYDELAEQENAARDMLTTIDRRYEGLVNQDNASDIIRAAMAKKQKEEGLSE